MFLTPIHESGMAQPRTNLNAAVQLFPRRKAGTSSSPIPKGRSPMLFSYHAVSSLFGTPQTDAAQRLGISLTSLKQVCRKLGVARWPYARPRKANHRVRAAVEAVQTRAEESDSSDACSQSSAETAFASPVSRCLPPRENIPDFPGPLAALPGAQFECAARRSAPATFAAERNGGEAMRSYQCHFDDAVECRGGQAMRSYQCHFDDAVFLPSKTLPLRARGISVQNTFQNPVAGVTCCESEREEIEDASDLSWLVSDTEHGEEEWWLAQARRTCDDAWALCHRSAFL